MNALLALLIVAGMLYGVLFDATFWKIYFVLVLCYLLFVVMYTNRRDNPKRRTLTIATWGRKFFSLNLL